MSLTRVK